MVDEQLGGMGNSQNQEPVPETINPGQTATAEQVIAEKMIPQSEVNRIIGKRLEQERARHQSEQSQFQNPPQQQQQQMGGMQNISPDMLRKMIADETQGLLEQANHVAMSKQTANEFVNKLASGAMKYPDFDEKVAALELPRLPDIVRLANSVDNTAEVVYDLANNPHKIGSIISLARDPNTLHLAQIEMRKLSNSIKTNEAAMQSNNSASEPLSQMRPSVVGTDNGNMTIRDLRNQSWMKA